MITEWIATPELKKVTVEDSTGKVTGVVRIAFENTNHVVVNTETHANTSTDDEPGLMCRKVDWSVNIHLYRRDNRTWVEGEKVYDFEVSKRHAASGGYAPKATRAIIVAALVATVDKHWTPELAQQAERAHAARKLHVLEPELDKAREEVARIEREMIPFQKIVYG